MEEAGSAEDAAAWGAAERTVRRDFPGGEVVARESLRRMPDGGAAALLRVGFAGAGLRGSTMWVRVHVPPTD